MKPPKDLASKFEAKLASKAREEDEALEQKRRDEEAAKIAVSEHCFVLEMLWKNFSILSQPQSFCFSLGT